MFRICINIFTSYIHSPYLHIFGKFTREGLTMINYKELAGQVFFSLLGIIVVPLLLLYILVATGHLGMTAYKAISVGYMCIILYAHVKSYNDYGKKLDFADRLEERFRKDD